MGKHIQKEEGYSWLVEDKVFNEWCKVNNYSSLPISSSYKKEYVSNSLPEADYSVFLVFSSFCYLVRSVCR